MSKEVNRLELASKLEAILDSEVNEDTKLSLPPNEWRVLIAALKENDMMKCVLEMIRDTAERPLYYEIEVGFRHTPLTTPEKIERYKEQFESIYIDAKFQLEALEK